jgi:hypothetical protein
MSKREREEETKEDTIKKKSNRDLVDTMYDVGNYTGNELYTSPFGDFSPSDVPSYSREEIVRPYLEEQGDLSLIVIVVFAHGYNPKPPKKMVVHDDCALLKASATPKGCLFRNNKNPKVHERFDKILKFLVLRHRNEISANYRNDENDRNDEIFKEIRSEYLRNYLRIWNIRTINSVTSTKNDNLTYIREGNTEALFELTYGSHLFNKYYLKKEAITKISIVYDSRHPTDQDIRYLDAYEPIPEGFPFATMLPEENSGINQEFTLQHIYNIFRSYGFKTIYIFDLSCDDGSGDYPEGYRGGKKKKKTYKKNKKTLRRKNKNKYTKKEK